MNLVRHLTQADLDAAQRRTDRVICANYGKMPTLKLATALGATAYTIVGRAKSLGLIATLAWSAREDRLIRAHYRGRDSASIDALVAVLGRKRHQITHRAKVLGCVIDTRRRWTDADTELLSVLWGRKPDRVVAKRLGRTVEACDLRAQRALGRCRLDGVQGWTARGVARLLGVDSHKPGRWAAQGWLAMDVAPFGYGKHRVKVVAESSLLRFLREHPTEYDWRKMADPSGYYQRIARERQAGLLTTAEVAARYGMTASGVQAWLAKGWLPGVKGNTSGGTGKWYIREVDLAGWMPPRPELIGHRGRGKGKVVAS